jgi:hypothetical protein
MSHQRDRHASRLTKSQRQDSIFISFALIGPGLIGGFIGGDCES